MSERVKNDSTERHRVLRDLIREGEASTQEELCDALRRKKFDVNQSTVSRDLRRIGAVKAFDQQGEVIYKLPEDHRTMSRGDHDVSVLIVDVEANETMIVIHTSPGSASLVAADFDRMKSTLGILGTLSGDDTIFIAPVSVKKIASVVKKIREEYIE